MSEPTSSRRAFLSLVTGPRHAVLRGLVLAAALWLVGHVEAAPGQVSLVTVGDLRCEYLVDPLAVDTSAPRLTWTLDADARGVKQSAYQIIVASSAALLAAHRGDLWDTGRLASRETALIEYRGRPLVSRQRAFWKVRAWDEAGQASAWSPVAHWAMALRQPADWTARWIGDARPSTDDVSPAMLRRQFTLASAPVRAVVYATALGVYELHINGRRVGDQVLAPEFTDYDRRTQYQAYDVTPMLRQGPNVIGAILGDGWYAGGMGSAQALIGKRRSIYGTHPRLLTQLEVELPGGVRHTVTTDGDWRVTRDGPIRSSDLLNGEIYDARREIPGWNLPGFDDATWGRADVAAAPGTRLVSQVHEPIRVTEDLTPVSVTSPVPGVYVFDLGQNMVGWSRLTLRADPGATITLMHAEMLYEDGTAYTANLREAAQTDRYIARGSTEAPEVFEPHFTYHGFRYVQVLGLTRAPQRTDLVGRQVNSALAQHGTFASSSALVSKLWQNVQWTQRGNMMGIPTDCPQRDERHGWLGDMQVFAGAGIFNAGMGAFLTKWMHDVRDAQTGDGRFPDYAPHPFQKTLADQGRRDFTGAPGWGDAGVLIPWRLWQMYGDRRQLEESYPSAVRWIDFIHSRNPGLLWTNARGSDYGDFLNSDTVDHPSVSKTGGAIPKPVFATMMFAHTTRIVAQMAEALGRDAEAIRYHTLSRDITTAFQAAHVSADGRIEGGTQAGYALALHFDLLPEALRSAALRHMVAGIDAYRGHLSTGIHATHRMMIELSRAGRSDIAYGLINQTTLPSWGHAIGQGATTTWERWDGYVKGSGFQDSQMNSFNHYATGAVAEWIYRVVLGINDNPAEPGFRRFSIRPVPGGGLTWAKGSYQSIRGTIESGWRLVDGALTMDVRVPPNTVAEVFVPAGSAEQVSEGGTPAASAPGVRWLRMQDGAAVFEVQSGRYSFVRKTSNLRRREGTDT